MVCPQLGVKALTYNDLIQAQKEISAHNQQLREQTEQLEKGNRELRSQSLRLVSIPGRVGPLLAPVYHQDALRAPGASQTRALIFTARAPSALPPPTAQGP